MLDDDEVRRLVARGELDLDGLLRRQAGLVTRTQARLLGLAVHQNRNVRAGDGDRDRDRVSYLTERR